MTDTSRSGAAIRPNRLRRTLILLIPTGFFLVLVGFFAAGLQHDPQLLPSALIDQPAPDFDLPALLADRPGLAHKDLGGKPVLVNFFASWCAPCKVEEPILIAFAEQQHIPLYGIDYKDRPEDGKQYLSSLGNPYARIGVDASGRTGIDFGIYGVPETFIIDGAGRVRFRYPGPLSEDAMEQEIMPRLRALQSARPIEHDEKTAAAKL